MIDLPQICREVRLLTRPQGLPGPEHFEIAAAPLRRPGAQELLVRNRWFRVSISARTMMSERAENVKGIPFPTFKPGDALADGAIGAVVWAPDGCGFKPGDLLSHPLGWRDYAIVPLQDVVPLLPGCSDPIAYLGHGGTAYAALTRGVEVRPGDRVFISSGAGAIGSMAGQIARRLGAGRVIGSTGSAEKADWMQAELGYDAVLRRDLGPIAEQLAACAPDGIDVYVDMVGGEQLRAATAAARDGARFVLLGTLSGELAAGGAGMAAPVQLDSFQLIVKGVTLRGYSACEDDRSLFKEWTERLAGWQRDGGINLTCSTFSGLENAPQALHEACAGRLKGLVLVALDDPDKQP